VIWATLGKILIKMVFFAVNHALQSLQQRFDYFSRRCRIRCDMSILLTPHKPRYFFTGTNRYKAKRTAILKRGEDLRARSKAWGRRTRKAAKTTVPETGHFVEFDAK
jgi:hypothetical protein